MHQAMPLGEEHRVIFPNSWLLSLVAHLSPIKKNKKNYRTKDRDVIKMFQCKPTADSCKSSHLLKTQHHGHLSASCKSKRKLALLRFFFFLTDKQQYQIKSTGTLHYLSLELFTLGFYPDLKSGIALDTIKVLLYSFYLMVMNRLWI